MRPSHIFLCALVSVTSIASTHASDVTLDGRFGTQCMPAPGGRVGLCLVSIYKLIARPEFYDKKKVEITGYVFHTFGRYVIFPSRASYELNISGEGIELQGDLRIDPGFAGDIKDGRQPVRISGFFDARYQGPGPVRLGALTNVRIYNYKFING